MSYASVAGHRRMALDTIRNDAYARALADVITPDSVVLDLGAGTGVHGLVAARLGARRVYLVEPEDVIALADELAAANGLAERVTTVQGRIEDVDLPERADVEVAVTASGECHGWLAWLTIQLGRSWLSAGPASQRVHWTPAFLPVDPPLPLAGGERVRFTLERLPHGDWTWSVAAAAGGRRHSTLLARPMTRSTLERAALDYRPRRSADGDAVQHALALADGTRPTRQIAADLAARFPHRFRTVEAAVPFVQQVLRHYA